MSSGKSQKAYLKFGVTGSGIWAVIIIVVLVGLVDFSWSDFKTMKPNEWGDFLAGVFAPLAFFWFVVAFLQQGAELRASVDQFTQQAKSLEATNALESQKLAMAEWDRIHLEMSNILSSYLYKYSTHKISKEREKSKALEANAGSPKYVTKKDPSEFVQASWVRYSQGDKNTFFRTVFSHSNYKDTSCLKEFFKSRPEKKERFLQLQKRLSSLYHNNGLINNHYVTEEMVGVTNYLHSLNSYE